MSRSHTLQIRNLDRTLQVPEDVTLLQAAQGAGLAYPHGCRMGRCGACKSRLLAGEVEHLQHTPFALTESDRRRGFILACRAQPRADCVVSWLGSDTEDQAIREATGRVVSRENPASDITLLRLALEGAPLAFRAGQYAELSFGGCPPRNYSMANHPDDPLLEFHVQHVAGGATSGHVAKALREGDCVRVRGPMGSAHLRVRRSGPIVALAGGSGLAPIMSILKTAAALKLNQPVRLYVFARESSGFYREAEVSVLARSLPDFASRVVIGRAGYQAGFADDLPDLTGASVYVAGSPALVDAVSATLTERGLPAEQIFADAFYTVADQMA